MLLEYYNQAAAASGVGQILFPFNGNAGFLYRMKLVMRRLPEFTREFAVGTEMAFQ
jgi:hypothetical protein